MFFRPVAPPSGVVFRPVGPQSEAVFRPVGPPREAVFRPDGLLSKVVFRQGSTVHVESTCNTCRTFVYIMSSYSNQEFWFLSYLFFLQELINKVTKSYVKKGKLIKTETMPISPTSKPVDLILWSLGSLFEVFTASISHIITLLCNRHVMSF